MRKLFTSYWFRSTFFLFLQRFSLTIFGLINFVLLIRFLSKEQMGAWALFLVVTTFFETTKSGLLKNAHIKFVSGNTKSPDKTKIASSSLLINALISIVFILFLLLFSDWLGKVLNTGTKLTRMLMWFIPGLIGMVFFSHFEAIQQSHFDFKGVFAGQFVRQSFFFIIIFFHYVFKIPFELYQLALYQSVSIVLGAFTLFVFSKKHLLFRFDPSYSWVKKIIGFGGYIFGSGLISNIVSNIDQLATASYISSSSVAYYNAATRINGFIDIPSYAASEMLFPKMAQASENEGINRVKYLYEKMVSILLSFIIPSAVFIIIFPKFVIGVIAGSQYFMAAPILRLYMINSIVGTLQNQAANTLNSIGKPALCFKLNMVSFSAKLIFTMLFLKTVGFYGAAIATLVTSVVAGLLWYYMLKKEVGINIVSIGKYLIDFYKTTYSFLLGFFRKGKAVN